MIKIKSSDSGRAPALCPTTHLSAKLKVNPFQALLLPGYEDVNT